VSSVSEGILKAAAANTKQSGVPKDSSSSLQHIDHHAPGLSVSSASLVRAADCCNTKVAGQQFLSWLFLASMP
jgi:hypothetical protein